MKRWKGVMALLLALTLLAGCSQSAVVPEGTDGVTGESETVYTGIVSMEEIDLEDEAVALSAGPVALYDLLLPEASGTAEKKNSRAVIDYSNVEDGYVMVKFTDTTEQRLKVQVFGPTTEDPYKYDLNQGEWTVFPLSDGNGNYRVTVYERNPKTGKYASVVSASFEVKLKDEFAPFLRPNQYVDYAEQENTLAKAEELMGDIDKTPEKVAAVYDFVVNHLTYDKDKAKKVQSGDLTTYLPVLDDVLAAKKGICFDYAALMTGMLRSQGIPCKLVVGYAGKDYHAWISVWTEETGWIEGFVYFDGVSWQRMDPTFASSASRASASSSSKTMEFMGDGSNYHAKYLY